MDPVIIFSDDSLLAINKPAGYSIEPPAETPTIQDWLVEHNFIDLNNWRVGERPGVVHRLDVDTSGILIWAKNPVAQARLKLAWQARQVDKTYIGIVAGEIGERGEIELAIKRDNKQDKQIISWLNEPGSRPAITHFRRLASSSIRGQKVSLIEAKPITGRTHQIRVHMQSKNNPIIGDSRYGNKLSREIAEWIGLKRHWLHAARLCLPEPKKCFVAPLPPELIQSLEKCGFSISDIPIYKKKS